MVEGIVSRRALDKLTDRAVKAFAETAEHGKKISDGGALYLTKTPAGSAAWRINFRYAGKYRTYSVGTYPDVSLKRAREVRAGVRAMLAKGIDPVTAKRTERLANIAESRQGRAELTFREFALEWVQRRKLKRGWSETHSVQVEKALERHTLNRFGTQPLSKVTQAMVIETTESLIAKRRYETASKLLQNLELIFKSAVFRNLRADNPAHGVAAELIPGGLTANRRPALLEFDELGDVLRRTELAPVAPVVRLALRLVAFTAARIGNVLEASWNQFDLDAEIPIWTIPREQMKMKRRNFDHRVILGPTIAGDLRRWRNVTGGKGYVFPAPGGGAHLRHETPEKVLRRTLGLEGKHTVHGWRSAFSTRAKESGLFSRDAINLTLDHVHDSEVARAYDRGERLEERIKLMTWWDAQLTAAESVTRSLPQGGTA